MEQTWRQLYSYDGLEIYAVGKQALQTLLKTSYLCLKFERWFNFWNIHHILKWSKSSSTCSVNSDYFVFINILLSVFHNISSFILIHK